MKPRIKKIAGIWQCTYIGTRTGLGYTPKTAYTDWYVRRYGAIAA